MICSYRIEEVIGVTQRRRWIRWALLLGTILAVGLAWKFAVFTPHKTIDPSDVVRVELHPRGAGGHTLSSGDASKVTEWFNRTGGIRNNSHHGAPGCGIYSSLEFYLRSGDVVTVYSYMRVTRGKPNSGLDELAADYYFEQFDLEQYLRGWDGKGC